MRRSSLFFAAVLLVVIPQSLTAQLGGLRRRAVEAVQPKPQQAQAVQVVVVPITNDVITNYLKALDARQQAMRTLARENSPIGRYFAATVKRDSLQRRQNEYKAETGPDFERASQLQAVIQRGDANAYKDLDQLQRSLDPSQVEIPEADWNAQRQGNNQLDSIAMTGGGFSAGEWAYVNDKFPPLVGQMSWHGAVDDSLVKAIAQSMAVAEGEVRLVRARRVELARALAMGYRTDAMIAKEKEDAKRSEETANGQQNANTYNGCLQAELKPMQEEAERRKTELETAAKNEDIAKLTEWANRVMAYQTAATQKCAPLLNQ
jgi:hypothetical protein